MTSSNKNTAKNNLASIVVPDSAYHKQKASRWAPFVFPGLLFVSLDSHAVDCHSQHYDQTVTVSRVYDGDTLQLASGKKIRLVGINTPERGKDGLPHQPFYLEAKRQLQEIVRKNHSQLKLVFGIDKHDRYKRQLAHIFSVDGKNISEIMIRKGLAYSIAIPPNLKFLDCYKRAENDARKHRRGIWGHHFSQPVKASVLNKSHLGFQRVKGKVQRIGESRSSYWLNLDKKFALRIPKKYLEHFTDYSPASLLNSRLIAHGWIYYQNNEYRMTVKHPAAIQLQKTD